MYSSELGLDMFGDMGVWNTPRLYRSPNIGPANLAIRTSRESVLMQFLISVLFTAWRKVHTLSFHKGFKENPGHRSK